MPEVEVNEKSIDRWKHEPELRLSVAEVQRLCRKRTVSTGLTVPEESDPPPEDAMRNAAADS